MKWSGKKVRGWQVIAVTLAISAGFCGLVGVTLLEARNDNWDRASQSARNLAHAISDDLQRTVESLDLSIRGVADNSQVPGVMNLSTEYRDMILFDRAATAKNLGSLMLLDAKGVPVAFAQSGRELPATLAERPYFSEHLNNATLGLYVSEPFRSRFSGEQTIALSRRINAADGSFNGVAVGTIRLDSIHQLFAKMEVGPHGTITLFHTDGAVVMRVPYLNAYIGSDVTSSETYRRALVLQTGQFVAASNIDGISRLHSFTKVGTTPLRVAVSLSVKDIEAGWWRHAALVGSGAMVIVAALMLAAWRLLRELRKRQEAEAATQESEASFRLLAENCSDMVCRIGPDGVRRYVSPASRRLLGKAPEQLVGSRSQEDIHPNDIDAVQQATQPPMGTATEDATVTYRVRRADGSWIWVESALHMVHDPMTGLPDGMVTVSRDVTERKKVENELARLATLDGLTGIANRRSLDETLDREWRRCARAELPLSLLLVDIDKFKALNDSQGHQKGDECLRQVGAIIGSTVRRASDFSARYGGEEFAVLLPETDATGASAVAERVRAEVEALGFPNEAGGMPGGVITVSIGGATLWPVPGEEKTGPVALIHMADQCLYQAKREGRNRTAHDSISFQLAIPSVSSG
jgi:diguanylate cyclase (GGDEF)-like protein/PAS domain S-box-containing protein